jgi:hypothetical protein
MDAHRAPLDQENAAPARRHLIRCFALTIGAVAALAALLVILNGREPYAGLPDP